MQVSKTATENGGDLTQTEAHLYGSSRLGIYTLSRKVEHRVINTDGKYTFERGNKFFELSNHLGNVLVTVSDRKLQASAGGVNVDYYNADVVTATDYYPFGMDMPSRKFGAAGRYGFNGKERDKDMNSLTAYDYGFRIYNPAIGKFLSVDPLSKAYPELTPYQFASNSPIVGIDLDGLEFLVYLTDLVKENGVTKLKVVEYAGRSDVNLELIIKASVSIGLFNGILDTDIDLPPIAIPFKLSDIGIQANAISVNNQLRVLPEGLDWSNLPGPDDPFWESLETTDQYIEKVVKGANDLIQTIDGVNDLRNLLGIIKIDVLKNSKKGQKLGIKGESNLDPPEIREKRLRQLSKDRRPDYKSGNKKSGKLSQIDEVWEEAKRKSGGTILDPKTNKVIEWDRKKGRGKQWQMGHKPGKEWWRLKEKYQNGEINWEQLKKEYQDPNNYRPELPSSNMSNNKKT